MQRHIQYGIYNNLVYKNNSKMSSQSGSDYNNGVKTNKSKKTKAQPIISEKRTRRNNRKNQQIEQSQNVLPSNIPITDGDELIVYKSFELENTKSIIQIPANLFKSLKMQKEQWTRVGETILDIKFTNNQLQQLIIQAKLKIQKSNYHENGMIQQKNQQNSQQQGQQATFLVWGKVNWIGSRQVFSKTIKQSPKIVNTQTYSQIIRIKTKDIISDIFVVLNIKKKIQCVMDHNGLINQGNTCYMNSYLQMLSHISQFKNLVFQAPVVDENKFPATLQLLFYKLDNEQKPVSAEMLVKSFGWSKKQANIQQDAQQFSCLFYDVLQRKLQEACPDPKHLSMNQLFEGKLLHLIQCLQVGTYAFYSDYSSQNIQPFFNIPLSLSNSLQKSLDDYVAQQILNEDNMYQTELYGPQIAKKSAKFLVLPPIIMIQLKRFEFNYNKGVNQKIMHHFQYPNVIDFSKWQVSTTEPCEYELYAVLVHQGIKAESGHYYAYVKVHDDWYRFNDQQVSLASKLQVFDYNFGGQIDVIEFDSREFNVFSRKITSSSTAYMLVYVRSQMKQKLLLGQPIYPQWLQQHEIVKQEQRQQIKSRKNFYHNIQILDWQSDIKDTVGDFLGIIPKNIEEWQGNSIQKISKSQKVQEWVKPYNQKGVGAYIYLTSFQKIQYQTLINVQHRKSNFQQLIRQPNCPITIIFFPIITHLQSLLYVIKLVIPKLKFGEQGEHQHQISIKFHNLLEINRSSKNNQLLSKLKAIYDEIGYKTRYFYQEKKQLIQIQNDNTYIRGPPLQRNILNIIIVQKIEQELVEKFKNPTENWYNDLKNFVSILIKSQNEKYQFEIQIDQNKTVQYLREYIFKQKIKQQEACLSSDNIVLKGKLKKAAKNYVEIPGAKTIRDLIKNSDKQNIIVFGFSNLKTEQRINQIQVKFSFRFANFTFSEPFHVILNRNSQNQSVDIYKKISDHPQVQKYRKMQGMEGIRIFLFSKDKNVINDVISENGHVHGKGQIAQVLQKQKGSHLIVQSFPQVKIEQNICPVLFHHRSCNDQKIGIPRYFQFNRSTKLTQVYEQILQLVKDQSYDWQQKKVKINPMKVSVYAFSKDYNKGIYLADQEYLKQYQINQQANIQKQKEQKKSMEQNKKLVNQLTLNQEIQDNQQKSKQKSNGKTEQEAIIINSPDSQKQKIEQQACTNNNNNAQLMQNIQNDNLNGQKPANVRKNSKNQQKIKPWQKTIDIAFPRVKVLKIVMHHLYLTKAQSTMKINVE